MNKPRLPLIISGMLLLTCSPAVAPTDTPAYRNGVVSTFTGPDGRAIYFPKQAPTNAYMDALLDGTLVLDPNGCLRMPDEPKDAILILWHHDFSLRVTGQQVEVLNGSGQVVGRIGPCCGASPADVPYVWQFPYTVKKIAGEFRVMQGPVYLP